MTRRKFGGVEASKVSKEGRRDVAQASARLLRGPRRVTNLGKLRLPRSPILWKVSEDASRFMVQLSS